ncbi:hypothetical protein QN372_00850 [Undibacterium sp. RTI2.1]|uniref:hypothetical protein n=1 Tax=unclassified Undibacterium TaxID=2630295 RepID=UPI002AB3D9C7|nr:MULTISPECIES: hypothetical protein [unclassified Undibacterium]MDY7537685.1 hypothetical protein [Undibacterium sp. 5I1]MEB0029287.1 hypothetical protein [Undibacterium sp. RTI2.1]MEB0115595.1 hypothetical protein [Undibacterium sp. RTI2.2]MEB0256422.1 hypothetical protein [Undibacterium sp. 5I1]
MAFDPTKPAKAQTYGDALLSTQTNLGALNDAQNAHMADELAHNLTPLRQSRTDFIAHAVDTEAHGLTTQKARITALESETIASRGSMPSVASRLSVGLLASGAVRLASIANKWITPGDVPAFVNTTTFTVTGDRRGVFIAGANLRFTVAGQLVYAPVTSSSFASGVTTVLLDPAYPVLTSGLSGTLDLALIAFDNNIASALATTNASLTLLTTQMNNLMVEQIEDWLPGKPAASAVIKRFISARPFSIPISAAGSQCKAVTAATASTTFSMAKNGVTFGTIVFAAAGTVASFTVAASTTFAAGDMLAITGPATQDATLADIVFFIKGILQ